MSKLCIACAVVVLSTLPGALALADSGHLHIGIGVSFGVPIWGPPLYYPAPPDYYYPPPAVPPIGAVPPSSIPREAAPPELTRPHSAWYYCPSRSGYYPYVTHCPGGWQRITPVPSSP